jgi:hypothetical protein
MLVEQPVQEKRQVMEKRLVPEDLLRAGSVPS